MDPNRDKNIICVVENSYDIIVFEKTNGFNGLYHVLGGSLSPLDGIGPEELNIEGLKLRVKDGMEIILATNSNVEGETTALYLTKILYDKQIQLSRLARGIPIGSDLGYIDTATLVSDGGKNIRLNVPNILTVFRILLTPIFILCLFSSINMVI